MTKKERKRISDKKYYLKNRKELIKKSAEYNKNHREHRREYLAKYREEHREYFRKSNKKYYKGNREKISKATKIRYEANKVVYRARGRAYHRTINGFLMNKYKGMQYRVAGKLKGKFHLYYGLDLLDRDQFIEWSKNDKDFKKLFIQWEYSNYDMKFTPSPDRLNSNKGYTINNMEWTTHAENSRRGAVSPHRSR